VTGTPDSGGSRAPVWIAAALLALQGSATVVVAWRLGWPQGWATRFEAAPLAAVFEIVRSPALGFALLGTLAFGAAAGFLLVRGGAWLVAMILQILTLGASLAGHLAGGPTVTYVPMAYGVLMVFYLNSRAVRSILHGDEGREDAGG
jgi:hypothetical protein